MSGIESSAATMKATLPLPLPDDDKFIYPPSVHADLVPLFHETIVHPAIIVPSRRTAELRKSLKHVLMDRPKMRDVYEVPPSELLEGENAKSVRKLVLKLTLNGNKDVYDDEALQSVPGGDSSSAGGDSIRRSTHAIEISYGHFSVDEILRKILPDSIREVPSSFEVAGHLAHINLREETLPYKHIIGQTILDKNVGVNIVVNKIGTIENEFRTFPMEVLARRDASGDPGTPDLEVEVREEGCRFKLDFAKVYWNSRLQFEHRRLVELIAGKERVVASRQSNRKQKKKKRKSGSNSNDSVESQGNDKSGATGPVEVADMPKVVVADIMAGVGPFSVPLTSRFQGITCHANDLNPVSFRYLKENAKLNKCSDESLITYNMDGRAFVHHLDDQGIWFDHALMNLPASAPEFLDAFRGFNGFRDGGEQRPTIHVHCFGGKDDKADDEAIARCEKALGCPIDKVGDAASVHIVRDVSPKKNMLCVSFLLPLAVKDLDRIDLASGAKRKEGEEPAEKKARTE